MLRVGDASVEDILLVRDSGGLVVGCWVFGFCLSKHEKNGELDTRCGFQA